MTIAGDIENLRAELYSLTCHISELEDEFEATPCSSCEKEFYRNHIRRLRDDKSRVENSINEVRRKIIESGGQCDERLYTY